MKALLVLAAIAAAVATGCVRSEVTQLAPNAAVINARGSAFNSMGEVQQQMMLDAAELTLQNGYDYFAVVDSAAGFKTEYITTAPGSYSGHSNFQGTIYGNQLSGTSSSFGTYTPPTVSSFDKPRAAIQIQMFRGKMPEGDPKFFDARQVKAFLASQTN